METDDEANLSEQTKAEREAGRKMLAENQAKMVKAMAEREERRPPLNEADQVIADAVAKAKTRKAAVFPVADDKVKIN